jgi:hypothetical protein
MAYNEWDFEQLVFLDESAADGRTLNRRMGWSSRGFPCRVRRESIKIKRWSIFLALDENGYFAISMFQGSFNKERFMYFVSTAVLPRMNAFPGPRSVMVVDNGSAHNRDVS